jgi:hypothetical protein
MARINVSSEVLNGGPLSENQGCGFTLVLSAEKKGKAITDLVAENIVAMGTGISVSVGLEGSAPEPGPYRVTMLDFVNGFYFIKVSVDVFTHGPHADAPFTLAETVCFLLSISKDGDNGQTFCSFSSSRFGR